MHITHILHPFVFMWPEHAPYLKAAMRGGCDPYNSVVAVDDALQQELDRAEDELERARDAREHEYSMRVTA